MNKVILCGRLTSDPSIKDCNGTKVASYRLAVPKGKDKTDFISIKAFNKTAEFVEGYLKKGNKVIVVGCISTGQYKDKEGKTVYTTDIIAHEHEFCESKTSEPKEEPSSDDGFPFV